MVELGFFGSELSGWPSICLLIFSLELDLLVLAPLERLLASVAFESTVDVVFVCLVLALAPSCVPPIFENESLRDIVEPLRAFFLTSGPWLCLRDLTVVPVPGEGCGCG